VSEVEVLFNLVLNDVLKVTAEHLLVRDLQGMLNRKYTMKSNSIILEHVQSNKSNNTLK